MQDKEPEEQQAERRLREATEREWNAQRAADERLDIEKTKNLMAQGEAYAKSQLDLSKKRSAADRSFGEAAEFAKNQIRSNGLEGEVQAYSSEVRYTVAQGLKAAIHGREDISATFVLQRDILVRLDMVKSMLWVIMALLAFIAYKVA